MNNGDRKTGHNGKNLNLNGQEGSQGSAPAHCIAVSASGAQCRGWAMRDSQFCFVHDPLLRDLHLAASRKGGKGRVRLTLPVALPSLPARTPQDALLVMEETINRLRCREISPGEAVAMGSSVNVTLKAMQLGDLAEKVAQLEEELSALRSR